MSARKAKTATFELGDATQPVANVDDMSLEEITEGFPCECFNDAACCGAGAPLDCDDSKGADDCPESNAVVNFGPGPDDESDVYVVFTPDEVRRLVYQLESAKTLLTVYCARQYNRMSVDQNDLYHTRNFVLSEIPESAGPDGTLSVTVERASE